MNGKLQQPIEYAGGRAETSSIVRDGGQGRLSQSTTRALLLSATIFAILVVLWDLLIRASYFPHADNFALLANSCPPFNPTYSDWLFKGFHDYLYVYPDLSSHSSNFIRPIVNLVFFLNWFVFRSHWAAYLMANYLVIASLVGVSYFVAEQKLHLGWKLSLAAALCVAVAPSVDIASLMDPTFAFDLLCGLFVLCGVLALISEELISCWIFLTLAIFTKEASLFAPLLAALVVFLRFGEWGMPRRLRASSAFLLPLCAWLLLRWLDFRKERGLYVLMTRSSHGFARTTIARIYEGLLTWPLPVSVWTESSELQRLVDRGTLAVNIIVWLTAAVLIWRGVINAIGALRTGTRFRIRAESYPAFVIGIFCAGSLVMPITLDLARRFGGVFYPLFFLFLAMCIGRATSKRLTLAAASLMVATGLCGAYLMVSSFQKQVADARSSWTMARSYVDLLSSLREPVAFSLDDVAGGYSSDQYVKAFAGYQGHLVRINDLSVNLRCEGQLDLEARVVSNRTIRVDSRLPARCGGYVFDSLFPPLDPGLVDLSRALPDGTLHYHFNEDNPHSPSRSKELLVLITPNVNSGAIVYPDLKNLRYKAITFKMTADGLALSAPPD